MNNPIGSKQYQFLGKMFFKTKPEEAQSILRELVSTTHVPLEKIKTLHAATGIKDKRVFIGYVLLLYAPCILKNDHYELRMINPGLNRSLSIALNQSHPYTCKLIKETITYYNVYDDFKEKVNELVKINDRMVAV